MKYKFDKNTIWEDTGKIVVYNYPASYTETFSYITKVYRQFKKNNLGHTEVEGSPIYFHDMSPTQLAFARMMGECQNSLVNICKVDDFLTPIKE